MPITMQRERRRVTPRHDCNRIGVQQRPFEPRLGPCLKCGKSFRQYSPYNRVCEPCNRLNEREHKVYSVNFGGFR
jgi:hypothetical protein